MRSNETYNDDAFNRLCAARHRDVRAAGIGRIHARGAHGHRRGGYGLSFYLLSLTLRTLPVGIVYAVWSGAGIVLITLVATFLFKQTPDLPVMLGMGLIVAGVVVLNAFSKMSGALKRCVFICSARSSSDS